MFVEINDSFINSENITYIVFFDDELGGRIFFTNKESKRFSYTDPRFKAQLLETLRKK